VTRQTTKSFKGRIAAILAGAALVGVPSTGLAVSLISGAATGPAASRFVSFTPASADPEMARLIEARGSALRMRRFTPAGAAHSDDHAVTVAVRVQPQAAQAITVHNAIAGAASELTAAPTTRIAASRYSLGMARGYRSFAQAPAAPRQADAAARPVLSDFDLGSRARDEEPSRFNAHIALQEEGRTTPAAPRSLQSVGDQRLDVAGSYRLSRNVDVTAGVRYEQERSRTAALPDIDQQDSQAVYIGTQFRF